MKFPSYRQHKASRQAVVTIPHPGGRKDYYLGAWNSPESKAEYKRLIAVYCSSGPVALSRASGYLIREAVAAFTAQEFDNLCQRDRAHFRPILTTLVDLFGDTLLADFGPVRFEALRGQFVAKGWSRNYCNAQAARVKQFLRWLVGRELYPAHQLVAVREVPGLRAGKTKARECPRRVAVAEHHVQEVLPHLSPPFRGLVLFQFHTGCRPSEALGVRRTDIDTDGKVTLPNGTVRTFTGLWCYTPERHKSAWRGKPRYILIGPRGQAALADYMLTTGYLFPSRTGEPYTITTYAHAIRAACGAAGVPRWTAYALRHAAAQRIRDQSGEEAAKEVLGHSHLSMTAHYTSTGLERAAEALRKAG